MIYTVNSDKKFKTTIGGSALLEGIMMRGPDKLASVVRGPDGFVVREKDIPPVKYAVMKWPLVRGVVGFASAMKEAMEALNFSAEVLPEEESESGFEKWATEKFGDSAVRKAITGIAMLLGVVLAVGLFLVLPILLAGWLETLFAGRGVEFSRWRALFEGVIRMLIFFAYILAVSRMPDMKRVFAYHGAEHKTIHCYESGLELTTENVRSQSRKHPRCGTSFLLMVFIIGVLAFLWVSSQNIFVRVGLKLMMLPVVVAVSYEVNRFVGRHDGIFCRAVRAPGIWLQNLTTNEPDDSMIEVGIDALTRVIPKEKGSDEWK